MSATKQKPSAFLAVDLFSVKLDEIADGTLWIQAMPLGTYNHPVWGELDFTQERLDRFVKNFNDRVRGTDIDIDYEHKEYTSVAAGWVMACELRGDQGLWIQVRWTPAALRSLKDHEYRYFSPEFVDEWKHPKTGEVFKDVLLGGALTNRPFLKDIAPIPMSEKDTNTPGAGMHKLIKQLAESLGISVSDDSDEEKVGEEIATKLGELKTAAEKKPDPKPEVDPDLKKLAESNPALAKILADNEENTKRLAVLEAANRLSEAKRKLSETSKGNVTLTPAASELLSGIVVSLHEKTSKSLFDFIDMVITGKAVVELGERGGAHKATGDGSGAKKFSDLVEAAIKASEGKLSYADAATQVSREHPDVWAAYEADLMEVN